MKLILFFMAIICSAAQAQVADDFSDGDLTINPTWHFTTGDWIINASQQLQSANQIPNHRFAISTAMQPPFAEWNFAVILDFATSSANYMDVYLLADSSDLLHPQNAGYFVRLGGVQDEICLFRKTPSAEIKLIDGVDGSVAGSFNRVELNIRRSLQGHFILKRKVQGGIWFTEGSATDLTHQQNGWMGFVVQQSTASFFGRHFIEDVLVVPFVPDTIPPTVQRVVAVDSNTIRVYFSEVPDAASAADPFHYECNSGVGFPQTVIRDPVDASVYMLQFFGNLPVRTTLQLQVSGVHDLEGNMIMPAHIPFGFAPPQFGDVVIHEIMPDPVPQVNLPEVEWVELRNVSGFAMELEGWKFCRSPNACATLPPFVLEHDSLLIITSPNAQNLMQPYGNTIGVSGFPAMNNDGDELFLQDGAGNIIHAVKYSNTWYADDFKRQGGFSLEMKDVRFPCMQQNNWVASTNLNGGTPCTPNSVAEVLNDVDAPVPLRLWVTDSVTVFVEFDEPLLPSSVQAAAFQLSGFSQSVITAEAVPPLFNLVALQLSSALISGAIGTLTLSSLSDCVGNMASSHTLRLGLPEMAGQGDIIINEILFHPHAGDPDFIELYNNSNKVLNIGDLYIANRNASGNLNSIARIFNGHWLLFPGEYVVVTENPDLIRSRYVCEHPQQFISMFTPTWPNDKGYAIILTGTGEMLDELTYHKNWHAPLVQNPQGVSLERIRFDDETGNSANWHSAAQSSGYATPTGRNSQMAAAGSSGEAFSLSSPVVHLPHDGRDDYTLVQYQFSEPGYIANVIIFDMNGRIVRRLCNSVLCGMEGMWKWDGLGDGWKILPVGMYIILVEAMHPNGNKTVKKLMIAVTHSP